MLPFYRRIDVSDKSLPRYNAAALFPEMCGHAKRSHCNLNELGNYVFRMRLAHVNM